MDRVLRQSFGLAGMRMATIGPVPQDHIHAEVELNLVEGEPLPYLFAGQRLDLPVGRWLAYWGSIPHRSLGRSRTCALVWITLPLHLFLTWAEQGLAARLFAGEVVALPEADPGALARAREWVAAITHGDATASRILSLELEALVLRLGRDGSALAGSGAPRAARNERAPGATARGRGAAAVAVERMCDFLGRSYQRRVRVADCAAAGGLSPSHAMAVFQRDCGLSIGAYLTRLRLSHAQRLLLTSPGSVLEIALSAGFGSQARFYAAFRAACGTSPLAYRRARVPHGPPGPDA
jgi:AraC-like DNA-binding protein